MKTDLTRPHVYIQGKPIDVQLALNASDLLERLYDIDKILSKDCVLPSDYQTIKYIVKNGLLKNK